MTRRVVLTLPILLALLSGCAQRPMPLAPQSAKDGASDTRLQPGTVVEPHEGPGLSGIVFVDANGNGSHDGNEAGVPGVTVTLDDGKGSTNTVTDGDGNYSFEKVFGTVTVRIDASTAEKDFNESLEEWFNPTGPTSVEVDMDLYKGNAVVDFGFDPDTDEIIADVESETLPVNGLPTHVWRHAFRHAIQEKTFHEFSPAVLLGIVNQIEDLFLPEPFQFTNGEEFEEVFALLENPRSGDPIDVLTRQLLVAELNYTTGRGLSTQPELQAALLSWVETLINEASSGGPASASGGASINGGGFSIEERIDDATDVMAIINNARGGGGIPQ